jgi:hypothetical protein
MLYQSVYLLECLHLVVLTFDLLLALLFSQDLGLQTFVLVLLVGRLQTVHLDVQLLNLLHAQLEVALQLEVPLLFELLGALES